MFRMNRILPWLLPSALLLSWILASESGLAPDYLLPRPTVVAQTAYLYLFRKPGTAPYAGRFLTDALASLIRVGMGFGLAAGAGLVLGILAGRVAPARELLGTSVNAIRAVPGICWLPLALVWFGIGFHTTVFLVALAAFFPIYLNALTGVRQVDPLLLQAGAMMGTGRVSGIFRILIPAAMPHLIGGLRLGLGVSWAYLVLGELTGVPDGLGATIMDARMIGRIDIIVVGILLIAVMGRLSDQGLKLAMRLCFKSARRTT